MMQAYTEEQRKALIGLCRIEIKRWKAASESNPNMRYMVELMEIALAALTAKPVAWCPKTQIELLTKHRMVEADLCSTNRFDEIPLYAASPVAAPAVSLAELVLDENDNPQGFTDWYEHHFATQSYKGASHVTDCENAWRAAILRNGEEAK